jgi:hypothetical protein
MMDIDNIYTILIEVGFFGGLGLLYYMIQKKRILKRDLQNLLGDLYQLLEEIPASAPFIEDLASMMEDHNLEAIIHLLAEKKNLFSSEINNQIESFLTSLQYHQ